MSNSFYRLFLFLKKYPWSAVAVAIFSLIFAAYSLRSLSFNEDITKVIPKGTQQVSTAQLIQEMSISDKIAVIFTKTPEATDDDLILAAENFLDTIATFEDRYESVQGILDEATITNSMDFVYEHLPIYLDEEDYQHIEKQLHPDSISVQLQQRLQELTEGGAPFASELNAKDPLHISLLALKKLQSLQGASDYDFDNGFLFSKDHTRLFIFINPLYGESETKNTQAFINILNGIREDNNKQNTSVELSYFGAPFIAVANATQIKQDIITTVAISTTVLMLLLIFYYRNWLVPIIVMIPSVFGGALGLVALSLMRQEISAISLSISAILIGITIDYALHFLTHVKKKSSPQQLFKEVTKPLIMSSSTTAIAFLCLLFVRSDALVDLGIFASVAVVGSAVFTLILLPHIYRGNPIQHSHLIDRIALFPFERNKGLIAISLVALLVSLFTFTKVEFDGDLSKINYIPQDQQAAEQSLYEDNKIAKTLFVASYAKHPDEAIRKNDTVFSLLSHIPEITHIQSLHPLLPDSAKQKERIARWTQFWSAPHVKHASTALAKQSEALGFVEGAHEPFFQLISRSDFSLVKLQDIATLNPQIFQDFVHQSDKRTVLSTVISLKPEDRDAVVAQFEQANTGQHSILIDRKALNEQFLGHLITDFNSLVNYSFIAVIIILFVFYRRIELVLVAAIPIATTGFITAGIMGLFQIPFNIFSTIVCTLVFGHGVDFTIFMTSALQKEYSYGRNEMPLYRTSILLAVLTTILAVGALIFAKHPALKSISSIALIGVSVAVLVTFVLYPILFRFLFKNRIQKGLSPTTLALTLRSIVFFLYFSIASIIVSTTIRVCSIFFSANDERKWRIFGKWTSYYMSSVLFLYPRVSKRVFFKEHLKRSKQSIYIANHSSFLDTLSMGMLLPGSVFIVNDWVYRSPIFGRAVRALGFYPVSSGITEHLDRLKQRLGQEFSIIVFPEGTRSTTSVVHRFHKGAFSLAEKLQLPIQPVYIHGNADTLPKGDFIIYDNYSHLHIDTPYPLHTGQCGVGLHEQSKYFSKLFRRRLKEIRQSNEDENYFKQKLHLNYLYKERTWGRMASKDFTTHKAIYHQLFFDIAEDVKIAHVTNDCGQIDFLLVHQFPSRKIRTYNENSIHREVSQSSYICQKFSVSYKQHVEDIWKNADTLLLSHLSTFEASIPASIEKIIVLCCTSTWNFNEFYCIKDTDKLQVWKRKERDDKHI